MKDEYIYAKLKGTVSNKTYYKKFNIIRDETIYFDNEFNPLTDLSETYEVDTWKSIKEFIEIRDKLN